MKDFETVPTDTRIGRWVKTIAHYRPDGTVRVWEQEGDQPWRLVSPPADPVIPQPRRESRGEPWWRKFAKGPKL